MTIPDTDILPLRKNLENIEDINRYINELVFSLTNRDAQVTGTLNGLILNNMETERDQNYTPILMDTVNTGTTFTYTHQIGWSFRSGLLTDVWFDILWTANIGAITGNMYVTLPYQVAQSEQMPFVGVCQSSGFAFTGGTECVINAIPNTFRAEIWNTGSGFTTANQGSTVSGRLIGFTRYIGQADEF